LRLPYRIARYAGGLCLFKNLFLGCRAVAQGLFEKPGGCVQPSSSSVPARLGRNQFICCHVDLFSPAKAVLVYVEAKRRLESTDVVFCVREDASAFLPRILRHGEYLAKRSRVVTRSAAAIKGLRAALFIEVPHHDAREATALNQ